VLRGGEYGPNYTAEHVAEAERKLEEAGLEKSILIDCSHGNSGKDHTRQPEILREIVAQRQGGTMAIIGAMIESNLREGKQKFPNPDEPLQYGVSITDACIGWEQTQQLVLQIAEQL
ncbi:MAG TPA: 3-deoxy-7-phosphoheptulonate synthase, partial [Planctomycetaceae bacterium]|nr:3-deoxy-7-phosphoheptulonate synthase [Planctomycetaceae bacterium]